MDRTTGSSSEKRGKGVLHREKRGRAGAGLKPVNRGGYWHIHGTVRHKNGSTRVRRATGLEARPETRIEAEEIMHEIEAEIRNEVRYGIKPSLAVSTAAHRYLKRPRSRPLGATDRNIIIEIAERFQLRKLDTIKPDEWVLWAEARMEGKAPSTRERFLNTVTAFLKWCAAPPREWVRDIPQFERDKQARNPNRRARRRVQELGPELIWVLIDNAAPHLMGQLVTLWETGARMSSILYGCRVCDLILAPGRSQITFNATKNGEDVTAALSDYGAAKLEEYLNWRGNLHDREAPLFLTHKKEPYADNEKAYGGQTKTAFNAMKRRAALHIRRHGAAAAIEAWRDGDKGRAREIAQDARSKAELVGKVTPHWFRHLLATRMLQEGDLRSTMSQAGWLDSRSALGYSHDVPEHRRAIIERLHGDRASLSFGTKPTRRTGKGVA